MRGKGLGAQTPVILIGALRRTFRRVKLWRGVEGSTLRRANVATRMPVLTGEADPSSAPGLGVAE
ncbi:MAG TPA: hypothetical protein VF665_05820, partial [Longimicrobium sp.]|uniref:hypothetical protein n=1 Tax=Longimicrobium sp. TaxID=2029185 RepID=UPI002EDA59F2